MNRKFIRDSNFILRGILNSDNCLDILKNFVEAFLKIQIQKIKINKSPQVENKSTKEYGIIDMRIVTKDNEELNVGIQIVDGDYIQNKMFLYYAKIHSNQILYGDNRKLAKTITINIIDMPFFSSDKYHRIIKIKTNIINDNILETIEMHVLELAKFTKELNNNFSDEDAWLSYLKGENENIIKLAKDRNKYIEKLDNLLEKYWKEEKI